MINVYKCLLLVHTTVIHIVKQNTKHCLRGLAVMCIFVF